MKIYQLLPGNRLVREASPEVLKFFYPEEKSYCFCYLFLLAAGSHQAHLPAHPPICFTLYFLVKEGSADSNRSIMTVVCAFQAKNLISSHSSTSSLEACSSITPILQVKEQVWELNRGINALTRKYFLHYALSSPGNFHLCLCLAEEAALCKAGQTLSLL